MPTERDDSADRFWRQVVARVGRPSAEELAAAERKLAEARDEPLPTAQVEAIVDRVVREPGPAPVIPMLHVGPSRLKRAAAAAGLIAVVVAPFLVWPEARDSVETLDYAQAVVLLQSPGQPVEHRRAALASVHGRVEFGQTVLRELRDAPGNPGPLRGLAANALAELEDLFREPWRRVDAPIPTDDELLAAADRAGAPALDLGARLRAAEELKVAIGVGLMSVRDAAELMPDLGVELESVRSLVLDQFWR